MPHAPALLASQLFTPPFKNSYQPGSHPAVLPSNSKKDIKCIVTNPEHPIFTHLGLLE